MSTIGTKYNLIDVARMTDAGGNIVALADVISTVNPNVAEIPFVEGNISTGLRFGRTSTDPTISWRKINGYVADSKHTTDQVDDLCGLMEAYSEVDKKLADLNGNTNAFRAQSARRFIKAMTKEFWDALWYANSFVDPEKMHGFAPRYDGIAAGETKGQLVNGAGAASDNTSIWVIKWSPDDVCCIYPKGSTGGLGQRDLGEVTDVSTSGKRQVYRSHFTWEPGLAVQNWKAVARICNIDVSNLATYGSSSDTSANLQYLLIDAMNLIDGIDDGIGQTRIYCNRTIKTALDKMANDAGNRNVNVNMVDGKPVTSFWGVPVRLSDSILNTEAAIS